MDLFQEKYGRWVLFPASSVLNDGAAVTATVFLSRTASVFAMSYGPYGLKPRWLSEILMGLSL